MSAARLRRPAHPTSRGLLAAATVLAAMTLAGCGGSAAAPGTSAAPPSGTSSAQSISAEPGPTESTSAPGGAASLPDSCALLTAADIQAVNATLGNPTGSGALTVTPKTTDVGPAVDQHSTCHYVLSGAGGAQFDLDIMTEAEYRSLDDFESPDPVPGLGDEGAVFGDRPAVRVGAVGALIANNQGSKKQGIELLKLVAAKL